MTVLRLTIKGKKWTVAQILEIPPLLQNDWKKSPCFLAYEITQPLKPTTPYSRATLDLWNRPHSVYRMCISLKDLLLTSLSLTKFFLRRDIKKRTWISLSLDTNCVCMHAPLQLCLAVCDPVVCSPPGSSVHDTKWVILFKRQWTQVPIWVVQFQFQCFSKLRKMQESWFLKNLSWKYLTVWSPVLPVLSEHRMPHSTWSPFQSVLKVSNSST